MICGHRSAICRLFATWALDFRLVTVICLYMPHIHRTALFIKCSRVLGDIYIYLRQATKLEYWLIHCWCVVLMYGCLLNCRTHILCSGAANNLHLHLENKGQLDFQSMMFDMLHSKIKRTLFWWPCGKCMAGLHLVEASYSCPHVLSRSALLPSRGWGKHGHAESIIGDFI